MTPLLNEIVHRALEYVSYTKYDRLRTYGKIDTKDRYGILLQGSDPLYETLARL
jgi:hypothetical protein